MIRYRLDDLGWYQFEWLIQSLLKADLGLGVESWGGHGDEGRDAYCAYALRFPAQELNDGPFIFQAKFVINANAAGAEVENTLIAAVDREARRIRDRLTTAEEPDHHAAKNYALLTNAPLDPELRARIESSLKKVLPGANVTSLGGSDVSDRLDQHPNIRKSFPQLLGLRDLDELIASALRKESRERSQAAIDAVREIAPTFVPTQAYERCWDVLSRHHFAVLEGPPEMGKTALGWMIGLAQLANGWEVIACNDPNDVYGSFDRAVPQLFIADDAFGRTEYDISRGRRWEQDLHGILSRLNSTHWLVLTSRKHVLERALKSLDLQAQAQYFPKPGEILVEANNLSEEEKALILYRHARGASLSDTARAVLKPQAPGIINDPSFTPERIRRFVRETLPELSPPETGSLDSFRQSFELQRRILESIRHPTIRMRRSFEQLPSADKWLLISLLEAGYWPLLSEVQHLYDLHCPADLKRPVNDLIEELRESFVNLTKRQTYVENQGTLVQTFSIAVSWMHPSYRDLVIEELSASELLRNAFLRSMTMPGIKLALSDAGGSRGERRMPLMVDDTSWTLLSERVLDLCVKASVAEGSDIVAAILSAHHSVGADRRQFLSDLMAQVLNKLVDRWNAQKACLTADQLQDVVEATLVCSPLPRIPDLAQSWQTAVTALESALADQWSFFRLDGRDIFADWVKLLVTVRNCEPRFLDVIDFPHKASDDNLIAEIAQSFSDHAGAISDASTKEEYESEIRSASKAIENLESLLSVLPKDMEWDELTRCTEFMRRKVDALRRDAQDSPSDTPKDSDSAKSERKVFDVRALFSDL